jgi:HEPN domain-containing protein/predicted nucleotidyltransferase
MDYDAQAHAAMQTDLSHLPRDKQRELEHIARTLRVEPGVEMLILYGSYARGGWKEEKDLAPDRWSGHASDYDLLVVVGDESTAREAGRWQRLEQQLNRESLSARAQLIVHDIDEVNTNLEEGRYFFLDLKREGRLLHDTGRFQLTEPKELSAQEMQRIAQADFEQYFERARDFYETYEVHYQKEKLRLAAFDLNQATESAYKAILLVFTGYCPHEHSLSWLGEQAEAFAPVYADIFSQDVPQAEECFTLLNKAYIGARYRKDFQVFWGDVEYLAPRVKELLAVTETRCREHIRALGAP